MPFPTFQGESIEVNLQFALLLRDGFADTDQLFGDVKVGWGAATATFTVHAAAGPIKTVADLMTAINSDRVVGAKASLDAAGHLNIHNPALRSNLVATGSLAVAGAELGTFAPPGARNLNLLVGTAAGLTGLTDLTDTRTLVLTSLNIFGQRKDSSGTFLFCDLKPGLQSLEVISDPGSTPYYFPAQIAVTVPMPSSMGAFSKAAGPIPDLLVGAAAGLTGATPLTDDRTLILTAGGAPVTFTVNTAAGPIKTVADLMAAVTADPIGVKATLDAAGHLNIQDIKLRGNLAATGSLAVAGAELGRFATSAGPNANLLLSASGGLIGGAPLDDAATLTLTSGAATVTFTVKAGGPIKNVADLMTAINADAVVGTKASLDPAGHLNIQDPAFRGNLAVTGSLAAGITFPDVALADPTLPLGDPGQTAAYKAQRQAATLLPTNAYPFLAGATLIRGTIMSAGQPLANANVQQVGGIDPAYITGTDGQFVLFLANPPGLPTQVTVNAKHAGLADGNANVTVVRGLTVSVTINM